MGHRPLRLARPSPRQMRRRTATIAFTVLDYIRIAKRRARRAGCRLKRLKVPLEAWAAWKAFNAILPGETVTCLGVELEPIFPPQP